MTLGSHSLTVPRRLLRALPVRALFVATVALACGFGSLAAQVDSTVDLDGRKQEATREELRAALTAADQIVASDGYSVELREQKRGEAALIRSRLDDGDFQVGDQIQLQVDGEQTLTANFPVGTGRVLILPNMPEISLRGVLRSELVPYLTEQIGRFIKQPTVRAKSLIRLSVLGGIPRQGFYNLPADMLLSEALMGAGGIGPGTDLQKSVVKRDQEEIVSSKVFNDALTNGITLDQLNLRAGDEINVGTRKSSNWLTTLRTVAIVPGLILGFVGLGKLAGIF